MTKKRTRKKTKKPAKPRVPRGPRNVDWARPGPKPRNGPTTITAFRIPEHVMSEIDRAAAAQGASRTQIVVDALASHLGVETPPEGVSAFD
jgi:hypothetical protein